VRLDQRQKGGLLLGRPFAFTQPRQKRAFSFLAVPLNKKSTPFSSLSSI
jgi:hypothetical protein